jgi:hypothetical protein
MSFLLVLESVFTVLGSHLNKSIAFWITTVSDFSAIIATQAMPHKVEFCGWRIKRILIFPE